MVETKFKVNPKYLFLLVFAMIGLSFASVPLYDLFCRVTGFGGTTQKTDTISKVVLNQNIKVRFDATKNGNLPVSFKPKENYHDIKVGEVDNIVFEVKNQSTHIISSTLCTSRYFTFNCYNIIVVLYSLIIK